MVLGALAAAGVAYASFVLASPSLSSRAISKSISWQNCSIFGYDDSQDSIKPQCGYFTVPADYKHAAAGSVTLAVAKRPATASPRLGTLFVNPGGPGQPGTQFVLTGDPQQVDVAGGHHDIVSWDPRGVGAGAGGFTSLDINCFTSPDQEAPYFSPNSTLSFGPPSRGNFTNAHHNDPDEIAFWAKEKETDGFLKAIKATCLENVGKNLTYVGTAATVRDLVSLAEVIDGPGKPINYWGISYGTVLGAYFVNMFPDRVGRVIIDGVLRPNWWSQDPQYLMWSKSIQDVELPFQEFCRACAEAGPTYCPIAQVKPNATQSDISAWFQEFLDLVYDKSSPQLTQPSQRSQIYGVMYAPYAWPLVAPVFWEVYQNLLGAPPNSTTASSIAIRSLHEKVHEITRRYDFSSATAAIACGDGADGVASSSTKDVFREVVTAAGVSQKFGEVWFVILNCNNWSVRATERFQGPWNHKLANKILVIGNKGDPITPHASAQWLTDQLGTSARLLTRDGYGHASIAEPSDCTNAVVAAYVVNGTLPAKGTVCATNKNYFGSPEVSSDSSKRWIES